MDEEITETGIPVIHTMQSRLMKEYDLILLAKKGERDQFAFESSICLVQANTGNDGTAINHIFRDEEDIRAAVALLVGRDSAVDNVLTILKADGEYNRLPKSLTIKQAQAFGWPAAEE
jgi:hypothetical protein